MDQTREREVCGVWSAISAFLDGIRQPVLEMQGTRPVKILPRCLLIVCCLPVVDNSVYMSASVAYSYVCVYLCVRVSAI